MAVNWAAVLNRCTPAVRKSVMDVRSRHEELRRLIQEARSTRLTPSFDRYRQSLPSSLHGLVSQYESKCSTIVPLDQVTSQSMIKKLTNQLAAWEQEKQSKLSASRQFIADLRDQIAGLEARLGRLQAAKPVDQLTVDDVYEMRPELREQFHRALKADCWASDPKAMADLEKAKEHH